MDSNLLSGTRVYLSGPMDFVGSRVIEKYLGWRAIVTPILKALGVTVLDPWNKPRVKGHKDYGKEGILPEKGRYENDFWTNKETRARFELDFWETVHIDCRMVDVADSILAFVPTNIYSVGTVHEIVLGRNQFKPVLLVSPPISYDYFPALKNLGAEERQALKFYGLKENPHGIPSQWYGNVVGGNNFFDGFGWEDIPFKSDDFYPRLIRHVLALAKPNDEQTTEFANWQRVSDWVAGDAGLQALQGGILDAVHFPDAEERALLEKELEHPNEQARTYFWYNHPYSPKRPALYQLFSIASGLIPTRSSIVTSLAADGSIQHQSHESIDDNWVIFDHTLQNDKIVESQ